MVPGGLIYFDISTMAYESFGKNKHWLCVVDEHTGMTWSLFLKKKSELATKMLDWVKETNYYGKGRNICIQHFRCDNAGENKSFEEMCKEKNYTAKFEYTAPGTPQQNGRVERKIAVIRAKTRAMLNWAKLPQNLR